MEGEAGDQSKVVALPSRYIHSNIFESLVQDEKDLVGLVAYSLYQGKKRRWIRNFQTQHGAQPSEKDIQGYCFTYQQPELDDLRRAAEGILGSFSSSYAESKMPQLQGAAFNRRTIEEIGQLKQKIDHISGYKHHIVGHIIGFFFLVFTYAVLTFVISHEPSIAAAIYGSEHAKTSEHK